MAKKYRVHLTGEEQGELKGLVSRGRTAAYRQTHARILLLCDENQADGAMRDEEIARALRVGTATVERVRRRCVEQGVEAALGLREQLRRRQRKLDGSGEAHLMAMACSQPPEGRVSWTLQMLADGLVQREIVESISAETVRRTLKKRTQALAEGVLVPPATRQRRVRLRPSSSGPWRTCWRCITVSSRTTRCWCAWTRPASNWCRRLANPSQPGPGRRHATITSTSATG